MRKSHQPEHEKFVANVRGSIEVLESRQRDLLGAIAEVKESLHTSRIELASLVNDRAPVASIPNEILAMIFHAGKDPSLKGWGPPPRVMGKQHNEVIVSHITKRFRTAALSAPSLWTEIYASPCRAPEELKAYLERSRACAVDIRLDLSKCCCSKRHQGMVNNILSMITPHSRRWRRLIVDGDDEEDANPLIIRLPDLPTGRLEHLSLSNVITNCSVSPTIFTGGAPLLSFLRMDYILMQHLPLPLPHPLSALTTLHVDEAFYEDTTMTYDQFRGFLSAVSTTLINLSISGTVFTFDPGSYPPEIVEMPALVSLRMGCPAEVAHVSIMGISAPGVRDWSLKDISDDLAQEVELWEKAVWEHLAAAHIFPDLHSLTIVNCEFSEFTVHNLARSFSTVSNLSLINIQPNILNTFYSTLKRGDRWQQLHTLAVWDCSALRAEATSLYAMLNARALQGCPIVRIELDEPDLEIFREFLGPLHNLELGLKEDYAWPPGLGYIDEDDVFV
jgi:hypothetical protein